MDALRRRRLQRLAVVEPFVDVGHGIVSGGLLGPPPVGSVRRTGGGVGSHGRQLAVATPI